MDFAKLISPTGVVPTDCGCRTGPNGRLCSTAYRLKNRLDAERVLAESNNHWHFYHEALAAATAHVSRIRFSS